MADLTLWQYLLIELAVAALAVAAAFLGPWQHVVARLEQPLRRVAERPVLCFWVVAGVALAARLLLLPVAPVPMPLYHDEFSYLLGADTFAHGRVTNPAPAVPIAFETIHTNMLPTYQSMYLPGPALLMSVGRVLGLPWLSVLILTALLPAAVYWMAAGWMPRRYALVAAAIAFAITQNLNWWYDNYFCLALSSLGCALVLGSVPRIAASVGAGWQGWDAESTRTGARPGPVTALLGLGLVCLLLTRPYEGCCVVVPCLLVLVWQIRRAGVGRILALCVAPVAMLAATFGFLLYMNVRGTGHALLFPYALNFRRYHITGPFLWSAKRPVPAYTIDMLRRFYTHAELPQWEFMRFDPLDFLLHKAAVYYFSFLLGFGLLLMPGLVLLARRSRAETLSLAPVLGFAGFVVNVVLMAWAPFPQYAAPAAPLLFLLAAFGVLAVRRWLRSEGSARPTGVAVVRGLLLAELMLGLSVLGYRISERQDFPEPQYVSKDRARVAEEVLSHPGKQLCLVRYTPFHDGWQEWVFNGADLPGERLLWARSLSPETDRAVMAAFPGRTVWLVKPDYARELVTPYTTKYGFPLPPEPPPAAPPAPPNAAAPRVPMAR